MTKAGLWYAVLITIAFVGGAATIVSLYQSGSASIPRWQAFFLPGPLSEKHRFLAGNCESCHAPTRGVEAAACIGCHSTAAADLAKQPTAFHADVQDCRGCHVEHAGAIRPIKMDHAALLGIGSHLKSGEQSHPSVPRQMVDDLKGFLGLPVSRLAEKTGLDCASCHSNREPHRDLFGRECANCHETGSWRIAGFLHPSPASKDCAQCHQAPPSHYMMHFQMMDKGVTGQEHAQVNQCFLGHRTDSWNDIKGVGWFKHH
ncbi:MAG: cytochrome c3 family protein [Bradyrhizobium sp.]|nr:cytochrome c3 family protein [Bradyrhizobium sp.]